MQDAGYLILVALTGGRLHGYGILQLVLEIGEIKLGAGTLYGALDRFVYEGLVEPAGEDVEAGRTRRYYRLTPAGRKRVAEETERRSALVRVAKRRLAAT